MSTTTKLWKLLLRPASRLYAKFDCPVARQNFSMLATAHDCETGSLLPAISDVYVCTAHRILLQQWQPCVKYSQCSRMSCYCVANKGEAAAVGLAWLPMLCENNSCQYVPNR